MHFRGPIQLANVAVYTPGKGKRDVPKVAHSKRHGHQHLHKKHHEHHQERAVGDTVVATINGEVVSWANTYAGPTADAAADAAPPAVTAASSPSADKPAKKPAGGNNQKPADKTPITGDFVRTAYYDAASGDADGLVFLANVGSPGVSGTWDT
jgi:hypothetical protein